MAYKLRLKHAALLGVAGIALTAGSSAFAQAPAPVQDQPSADEAPTEPAPPAARRPDQRRPASPDADEEEIIITGTQIRGIAPAGANAVGITREEAEQSGATDTQQLLGTLPQSNTFMAFQNPGSGVAAGVSRVPINLPNLRNLPAGSTGNPTTLVMMDGHRIVPSGIEQSAVDAGIVPTAIIERSEIILDGVSALYGSDAHGGVINFITRKRFDEISIGARYGFADDYWAVDADVTAGTTWDGGGFGATYTFAKNSPLFNKDRPERLTRNFLEGGRFTGTACEDHSTITASPAAGQPNQQFTANAGVPGVTPGVDFCPSNAFASFVAGQKRHGALATLSQDLSSAIKFELTGLYSFRESEVFFGPFTATQMNVRNTNPYFRSLVGVSNPNIPNTRPQTVAFSYGPVLGTDSSRATSTSKLWQVTPELSIDVGAWQIRALASYGESRVTTRQQSLDGNLQAAMFAGTTTATTNNPYDIAASTNLAQIQSLVWTNPRDGKHKFLQLRAVGDGPLFTLPAGEVRAAIGAEYLVTKFTQINTDSSTHQRREPESATTKPWGVFAEINVPIFGPENRRPGFELLTLSASARYDDYQQYGTTFNPKIAFTYEPVTWLTLRGNWGKSFRAPTAVDELGSAANRLTCVSAVGQGDGTCITSQFFTPLPPPPATPGSGDVSVSLLGANDVLKPETSKNWAVGADLRPIKGLTISPTYYHIALKDVIGIPSTGATGRQDLIYLGAPQLFFCVNNSPLHSPCTLAQLQAAAAAASTNGQAILQHIVSQGYTVAYISDTRTTNLGATTVAGVDLEVNYVRPTSWGSIDARFNGTWRLKEDSQFFATSPVVDGLATGESKFRSTATVGARYGNFRGQVTWLHSAGFKATPAATRDPSQTHIEAFDLFNVSFRYTIDGKAPLLQDLQLTLTVNNIFDSHPPINLTTTGGTTNGNTLGRFVQFGVSKEF